MLPENKKALLKAAKDLRKFYKGTVSESHLNSLAQVIEDVVNEEGGDDTVEPKTEG